jgi:hypothetical protein
MPFVGNRYIADGTGVGTPQAGNEAQSAQTAVAVTPSDSATVFFDALYVGVSGDISLIASNSSSAVVFKSVPVGILPVSCVRVNATLTTATNILGLTL